MEEYEFGEMIFEEKYQNIDDEDFWVPIQTTNDSTPFEKLKENKKKNWTLKLK